MWGIVHSGVVQSWPTFQCTEQVPAEVLCVLPPCAVPGDAGQAVCRHPRQAGHLYTGDRGAADTTGL